ncbi:MAG: hypothetical protein GY797_12380 [Deltaproteobacteria bacterium]|nr:hypothetical protein [Deltaproteobacteria bacterium]
MDKENERIKDANKKMEITESQGKTQIPKFTKYLDLIDYIRDWPKHKKHLILVGGKKDEAYNISKEIAIQIDRVYPGPHPEYSRCVLANDLNNASYDLLVEVVLELIGSEVLAITIANCVDVLHSLPLCFLRICKVFNLDTSKFLDAPGKAKKEHQTASNQKDNIFRYKGGHWEISFENKTIYPQDSKGLKYISYVVSHPRKEFHNLRLDQLVNGQTTGSVKKEQSLDKELKPIGVTKTNTSMEDKQYYFQMYKEWHDSLNNEERELEDEEKKIERDGLQTSRLEEICKRRCEIKEAKKTIAENIQSDGKTRKVLKNVYTAIYRSLEKICKEHNPLYQHLKVYFSNSTSFTAYYPLDNIYWETDYR